MAREQNNLLTSSSYYFALALSILPICFFFPYHAAFLSLALFGGWHILSEVHVWKEKGKDFFQENKSYVSQTIFSAGFFSFVSLLIYSSEKIGFGPFSHYPNIFLTTLGLWLFVFVIFETGFQLRTVYLVIICIGIFIYFAWTRSSLNYFFLVHAHNFLPWLVLYRLQGKRIIIFMAGFFSLFLPFLVFGFFSILKFNISDLSLSTELEQEIFRQIVSSELETIPGTTLLGYFAYQQILHYFLWIVIIPRLAGVIPVINMPWGQEKKLLKNMLILCALLTIILCFYLWPVEFRRIYFAIGFFHVAMEFPLLFSIYLQFKPI